MIPKPLNAIEWSDILELQERGREEDDSIEYKGQFSGGPDFLALNDQQRKNAVDVIAREVVAFLNARGGDIIIGAKEVGSENPAIGEITPVSNVQDTADRLDSALSELIQPKQAIIGVRAIRETPDTNDGVIIIRAPSSLRAPHWNMRNRDCQIRRGSKSVPMQMDEVQDVTLNRAMGRKERTTLLDSQFADLVHGVTGPRRLPARRFGIRMAFVPYANTEVTLTKECLDAMTGSDSPIYFGNEQSPNDVAFRQLPTQWRPILRGRQKEHLEQYDRDCPDDFEYVRKFIRSDGVMVSDFSCHGKSRRDNSTVEKIHFEWIIGFFANQLRSIENVLNISPSINLGAIRVCAYLSEEVHLVIGRHFAQSYTLQSGLTVIPDFEYSTNTSLDVIFRQLQQDVLSMAGLDFDQLWSLDPPA